MDRQMGVKRAIFVRVQIILNQVNLLNISVIRTDNVVQKFRIIGTCALFSRVGVTNALIQVVNQQDHTSTLPDILVVFSGSFTGFDPKANDYIIQKLTRAFVETQPGTPGINWPVVNDQYVLHFSQILAIYLADTPLLFEPRLEFTFFKTNRTDSS